MRHAVHFWPQPLSGWFWNIWYNGWLGVDLFFVLSGFLITHHLLQNWPNSNTKQYIYKYFYKRSLRILPLYFAILFIAVYRLIPYYTPDFDVTHFSILVHVIFIQDYFYYASILVPLWSLGAEEKFYLLAPAVLYLIHKYPLHRIIFGGIVVITLIIIIRSWFILSENDNVTYSEFFWQYRAPFHFSAVGILSGSIVALMFAKFKLTILTAPQNSILRYSSIAILVTVLIFQRWIESENWQLTSLIIALASVCFAVLIYCSLTNTEADDGPFSKLLRFIAKLSYPLYLVHLLVLPLAMSISKSILTNTTTVSFALFLLIYTTLSTLAAIILHLLVEKPFLLIKARG